MLVLFPQHIRTSIRSVLLSYVNTDKIKLKGIQSISKSVCSIQTQRIKLKEGIVSQVLKFAKEKFKMKNEICQTKIQKIFCCLKPTTVILQNDMPMIFAAI